MTGGLVIEAALFNLSGQSEVFIDCCDPHTRETCGVVVALNDESIKVDVGDLVTWIDDSGNGRRVAGGWVLWTPAELIDFSYSDHVECKHVEGEHYNIALRLLYGPGVFLDRKVERKCE